MQEMQETPTLSANSFFGKSGKKYIIHSSMTRIGFEVFEKLQIELQHGVSVTGFQSEGLKAYDLLNKGKVADAAVSLNNLLNGTARVSGDIPHPIFFICSLFICGEDEDRGKWSEADAIEKIRDWDGIDVDFFLASAKRFVLRYSNDLTKGFQSFSDNQNRAER